ncbi:MerR family transcriptional regulator [Shewanella submarina]|uniref:MerR family transcriptional regulator n=1 Tax=Shewanella submarina TaxID=2016376 RepID=A0ABV7GBF2_9GAMM|nr:MerR family transcriptional regulator [Shewanella submarina]
MDTEARLSIGDVAERTGVNPVTLRAWQRRFGLINPARTPKGHRLYSEQDISRIEDILRWLAKGVAISRVKPLLEQSIPTDANQGAENCSALDEWHQHREILLQAVIELNAGRLQSALDEASALYPFPVFFRHLLKPWIDAVELRLNQVDTGDGADTIPREDAELIASWLQAQLELRLHALAFGQKGPFKGHCILIDIEHSGWQSLLAGFELTAENMHWQQLSASALRQLPLAADRLTFHGLVLAVPADLPGSYLDELMTLQQTLGVPLALYGQYASVYHGVTSLTTINPGQLNSLPGLIEERL